MQIAWIERWTWLNLLLTISILSNMKSGHSAKLNLMRGKRAPAKPPLRPSDEIASTLPKEPKFATEVSIDDVDMSVDTNVSVYPDLLVCFDRNEVTCTCVLVVCRIFLTHPMR
jgi:hypothetical protein